MLLEIGLRGMYNGIGGTWDNVIGWIFRGFEEWLVRFDLGE
jgi:hypothetical protein